MARIRSIKPEFWDSPSTAKASPWGRLLFIAMWNWADDHGRGTANLKELEGFAFPNDDQFTDSSGNTVHFRSLVAEVSECFGVLFYEVGGRSYYAIPTWDEHQRNERRSKGSKHPSPDESSQVRQGADDFVAEIPCNRTETPRTSGPGTGEQGNRGTGEQFPPIGPPEGGTPRSSRKRPSTTIPSDWSPTTSHETKAQSLNLDVHAEADEYVNHAISKDRRLVDWDAGFHTWLTKSKGFKQQGTRFAPKGQAKEDANLANLADWVQSKQQQDALPFPGGDPA